MAIAIGQQVGSYEITALIGKGGMGEVYRARDTKLKREVAIKILPEEFSVDPDRVSRFQREAEVLASLNHPNIAAIYDFEQTNGLRYLILEMIEGETLAERLKGGPIPVSEVLRIAYQIAEALEAAHEKGVVHRDLKPANVKITLDGKVKVLDFGLAKAMENMPANTSLSNSPTLSVAATDAGVILGTAAYMSPEQAKGRSTDTRTDVFAFGSVLYEMLTGKRAFDAEDVSTNLARVIEREPDWTALPANTPAGIRKLLRRCVEKDPKRRLQAIGDARFEIEEAFTNPSNGASAKSVAAPAAWTRRVLPWAVAIGAIVISAAVIVSFQPRRRTPPGSLVRLEATLGIDGSVVTGTQTAIALSPDGTLLALVVQSLPNPRIYIRRLDQLQATPISGTEDASNPFFSPDSQWIGFFAGGKLKKISVTGGAPVTLCDAPNGRGGWWAEDGTIIFMPTVSGQGFVLQRISSAGGAPAPVTDRAEGEVGQRWPQMLPGARAVLYTATRTAGSYTDASIVVQPLPAGPRKVLVRGGYFGRYVRSGHLVYVHDGTLFAAPFDVRRLDVEGPFVPVLERVAANDANGAAQVSVSDTGTAAYMSGQSASLAAPMEWVDRSGNVKPLRTAASDWGNPQFSPTGRELAVDINDGKQTDVWTYDWSRDTLTRVTLDAGEHWRPVWTPDARRIAFSWAQPGASQNLYWRRADGGGDVQRLAASPFQYPSSWHPSGKFLAFEEFSPATNYDLMILPVEGDEASGWKPGKPTVFLNTPAVELSPMFSPDGRWIAYQSNESGRLEIYVRPFPGPGGKWQISTDGGTYPVWSRTRSELLYATDRRIMVVSYTAHEDSFIAERPRPWSDVLFATRSRGTFGPGKPFDLHPDGERVAIAPAPLSQGTSVDKLVFIFNFFDELRRLAPVSKK